MDKVAHADPFAVEKFKGNAAKTELLESGPGSMEAPKNSPHDSTCCSALVQLILNVFRMWQLGKWRIFGRVQLVFGGHSHLGYVEKLVDDVSDGL